MTEKQSFRKNRKASHERSIAVLWGPEGTWSIDAIQGVAEFAKLHGNWRMLFAPRDQQLRLRPPRGWKGDGILARLHTRQDRVRCLKYGIPVVDLETIVNTPYHRRLGNVITNDEVRCQIILAHFQHLQVKHIVCFNPPHLDYSGVRFQVFQNLARMAGYACPLFWSGSSRCWWQLKWAGQQALIKRWLKQLPRGTGIFTADGRQGCFLAEWCQFLDISIPDDIAIVTGDDDSLLCSISNPPLTGVMLAGKQHGFAAAALLQRMMNGESVPEEPIRIAPLRLIVRHSSDVLKFENPHVAQAIRYIHEHACDGINVNDVVQQVSISRRGLENHFLHDVGQTLSGEIRRVRLEKAKVELSNLNLSIRQIARTCGFAGVSQFCISFRKETGETPTSYRMRSRGT